MKIMIKTAIVIGTLVLSGMPLMGVDVGEMERGTLIVRGFNLMEFSWLGVLPLLVPVLALVFEKKHLQLMSLGIATLGYATSFCLARYWLQTVGDKAVIFYLGALIYPLAIVMVVLWNMGIFRLPPYGTNSHPSGNMR